MTHTTTEELRDEFIEKWGNQIDMYDDGSPIYPASVYDIADWWIAKLEAEKEMVKEELKRKVEEMEFCEVPHSSLRGDDDDNMWENALPWDRVSKPGALVGNYVVDAVLALLSSLKT